MPLFQNSHILSYLIYSVTKRGWGYVYVCGVGVGCICEGNVYLSQSVIALIFQYSQPIQRSFYLQFKLPAPLGGKHAVNPILVEDQPCPQNRVTKKSRGRNNVFDPDFGANSSPFLLNDVTSRAALLGIKSQKGHGQTNYWNKRNPNEVRKHGGKRK